MQCERDAALQRPQSGLALPYTELCIHYECVERKFSAEVGKVSVCTSVFDYSMRRVSPVLISLTCFSSAGDLHKHTDIHVHTHTHTHAHVDMHISATTGILTA